MNPSLPFGRPDHDVRNARHIDCTRETDFDSLDEAMFVRTVHGGHGPYCLQSLSAVAYLGGHSDDYE
ncbi:hypothetical protein [Nocardia paucivorans]|uniref:hypothetical protein n=1 Tax=Nocardia paucivorans TaxID=114259 RepID=UPI0002DF2DB7|nr:hypothetical protein [Nocardia paucivorans]